MEARLGAFVRPWLSSRRISEKQTGWDYYSGHLTLAKYGYTPRTERWIASGLAAFRVSVGRAERTVPSLRPRRPRDCRARTTSVGVCSCVLRG